MLRTEGTYEFREAGITNVSVGTLHGQLDGKDGYRNSYYHWTDNSGIARSAAVCLEYVGGNANGISVLSLQPLDKYGEGNGQLNKANLVAQSLGIPFGTIQNGMVCGARAFNNVSILSGKMSKAQYVNALTREGYGMLRAVKGLGYTCAGVSVAISGYQTVNYYVQGGKGHAVLLKGLADFGMVAVGVFGGPVGLGLSISYFVLDVSTDGFGVSYEVNP